MNHFDIENFPFKKTKQRMAILQILEDSEEAISAEIICELANQQQSMNLSTVYRILNAFNEKKIVKRIITFDNKALFKLHDHEHYHKVVCEVCKKNVKIECIFFETMTKDIEEQTGFEVKNHKLAFSGICPSCKAKLQKEKKS